MQVDSLVLGAVVKKSGGGNLHHCRVDSENMLYKHVKDPVALVNLHTLKHQYCALLVAKLFMNGKAPFRLPSCRRSGPCCRRDPRRTNVRYLPDDRTWW